MKIEIFGSFNLHSEATTLLNKKINRIYSTKILFSSQN